MSTMIHKHIEGLFSTKLNKWYRKRTRRRPSIDLTVETWHTNFVEKNQYDNTKSSPKFGRAIYTKEIVTIK